MTGPLKVTLKRAKETKNTVRYEEPASGNPPIIGTLYVQKWATVRLEEPETITVTMEAEGTPDNATTKKSLTSQLYSLARTSNNMRALSKGPNAYAKRVVRRKVYSKSMGATGKLLKIFGLSK